MAIKFLNDINVTGSVTSSTGLTLSGLSAQNSEATALVINGSGVVGTRELGSGAFGSGGGGITTSGQTGANRVAIFSSAAQLTIDSGFTYSSNVLTTEGLKITSVGEQSSEASSLMINSSGVVGQRELGSNAFTSTSYLAATGTAANSTLAGGLAVGTGRNNSANQIVRTQGNGYAEFGWINTTSGNTTNTITDVYVNTNDGYIRKATKTEFQSQMAIPTNAVLTTGAQTVAGIKTFSDDAKFSNNVGINGATSIDSPLDIAASTTSNNGLYQKWYYAANNETYTLSLKQTVTSGVVRYNFSMVNGGTAYDDVLVLDRGNIGIGTTSPSQKLVIRDGADTKMLGFGSPTGASSDPCIMASDSSGNLDRIFQRQISTNSVFVGDIDDNNGDVFVRAGGATELTIKNGGNVGIGTTSPSHKLEVNGDTAIAAINGATTSGKPMLFIGESNAYGAGFRWDSSLSLDIVDFDNTTPTSTSGTKIGHFKIRDEEFYWKGDVGIGTTAPTQKLDVAGNMVFSQRLIANSNQYYVKLGVWSAASTYGIGMTNAFTYGALNNDYAMTFCMNNDSDRGFWWGYDGQSKSTGAMSLNMQGKLKINHSIGLGTANPSATQGRIDASNDIVAYSTSDIRLKDNIKSIDKALDKVNSIQGIEFDWIEKEEVHGNSGHDIGVIAQEIEKILPDVVTTRENGYKAVKYEKIVPLLIEAIKDLSKQVDGLKRLI